MSALVLVMVLAFRTRNNSGFVAGGSWDFAMAIADRYTRLGGTVRYKARVTSVNVENNRAAGVRMRRRDGHSRRNRRFLRGRAHDDFQNAGRPVCGQKNPLPVRELPAVSGHHPGFAGNQENLPGCAAHAESAFAPAAPRGRSKATQPLGSGDVWFRFGALPGRDNRDDGQVADELRVLDRLEEERCAALPGRKKTCRSGNHRHPRQTVSRVWRSTSIVPTSRRPPRLCVTPATGRAVTKAGCQRRAFWAGAFPTRCRG